MLQTRQKVFQIVPECPRMYQNVQRSNLDTSLSERTGFLVRVNVFFLNAASVCPSVHFEIVPVDELVRRDEITSKIPHPKPHG